MQQHQSSRKTRRGKQAAIAAAIPEGALSAVSFDRVLRLKLQRRYQQLAARLKQPVTRLPTLPDVQTLGEVARLLPEGRDQLLRLIQAAVLDSDPDAMAWWAVYADLTPTERGRVHLDEVGLAAGVPFWDLLGVIVRIGARYGTQIGQLVFALSQPSVVAASAESARVIGVAGFEDRKMFMQGAGLAPVPKGHTTEVIVNASAAASAEAAPATRLGFLEDVADAGAAREAIQKQIVEGDVIAPVALPAGVVAAIEVPVETSVEIPVEVARPGRPPV